MSITIHPSPVPPERRNDPKRRAEMSVLDQLTASEYHGTAIYEWSAGDGSPEVDFALWVEDVGRFAIQVKGGHYDIQNYNWFLRLPHGPLEQKPSPVVQIRDGALAMSRVVKEVIGFTIYTIAVLVLPDMDPESHVAAIVASMMPVPPTNPPTHLPANATSVEENPPPFGDAAVASPVPLQPPTAAQG